MPPSDKAQANALFHVIRHNLKTSEAFHGMSVIDLRVFVKNPQRTMLKTHDDRLIQIFDK